MTEVSCIRTLGKNIRSLGNKVGENAEVMKINSKILTFVINLDKDVKKLKKNREDFGRFGVNPVRWVACYGKELKDSEILKYTNAWTFNFAAPSAIGCWRSHYTLWEYVVENGIDKMLILEDDAVPVDNFNLYFDDFIFNLPEDFHFCYLGWRGVGGGVSMEKIGGSVYRKLDGVIYGLHGYLISYEGAKFCVDKLRTINFTGHVDLGVLLLTDEMNVYMPRKPIINSYIEDSNNIAVHDDCVYRFIEKSMGNETAWVLSGQFANVRKLGWALDIYNLIKIIVMIVCVILIFRFIVGFFKYETNVRYVYLHR